MEENNNGWAEYKRRVLYQLDELTKSNESIEKKLDDLKTDVIILKTKAVLYGAIAGLAVTIVVQVVLQFIHV